MSCIKCSDWYKEVKLLYFLIQLRKEYRHKRAPLLLSGLPSPCRSLMSAYIDDQRK
jgi:hypothetical protein